MEFQFPANPQVGDTVTNETTGVNYVFASPGVWKISAIANTVSGAPVYEGSSPPTEDSGYALWFDTNVLALKYYYVDSSGEGEWILASFDDLSVEALLATVAQMSNVIIDLQTKVNTLESTSFLTLE